MKKKIKDMYFYIYDYIKHVVKAKRKYKINILLRIRMYILGFKSDDYILYNLKRNNKKSYITEIERWKTRRINGVYNICLDNKNIFYEMFSKYVDIPQNAFFINTGKIKDFNGQKATYKDIISYIKSYRKIIIKPIVGGGGKGVYVIEYTEENKYNLDYKEISLNDLIDFIKKMKECVIVEFAEQADYAKTIYPLSTNTIRIITIYDEFEKKYIIPLAVHRFGNKDSKPVDNICRGGYVTQIDIKNGVLGDTKKLGNLATLSTHPDTGAEIKGVKIPNWKYVVDTILKVAEKFPYIDYIAWDVLITNYGFKIIEANASSDLDIFQIWNGLRNEKFGEILKQKGIIR